MTINELCPHCQGWVRAGTTCPRSIACPRGGCPAKPGQPCKRPSGHRAAELHMERIEAAEKIDREKGITYDQ